MTATQVIEEIERMPKAEQERVFAFVAMKSPASNGRSDQVSYMDPQQAKAISDELFRDHPELFRKLAQ